jgi:hypothetical protein
MVPTIAPGVVMRCATGVCRPTNVKDAPSVRFSPSRARRPALTRLYGLVGPGACQGFPDRDMPPVSEWRVETMVARRDLCREVH